MAELMPTKRTAEKAVRDLAVMLALSALLWVSDNAADIGLPEQAVPIVAGGAMLVYRYLRGVFGKEPD